MLRNWLFLVLAPISVIPVNGQFRFGLQGGINVSTLVEKNYRHDYAQNFYTVGFNAGPVAEFRFTDHLSVSGAVILETKGTQGSVHLDTIQADVGTRLIYLDLPVMLRGKLKARSVAFFMELGGYAGMGLTGKATYKTSTRSSSQDVKWGSGTDDEFVRPDFGGIAGGGIEWNHFYLEGTFMLGLANIFAIRELDYNIQHRVFGLKIGYFLRK